MNLLERLGPLWSFEMNLLERLGPLWSFEMNLLERLEPRGDGWDGSKRPLGTLGWI